MRLLNILASIAADGRREQVIQPDGWTCEHNVGMVNPAEYMTRRPLIRAKRISAHWSRAQRCYVAAARGNHGGVTCFCSDSVEELLWWLNECAFKPSGEDNEDLAV
jgi:hypothetical protein